MSTHINKPQGRSRRGIGVIERSFRVEQGLYQDVADLAKRRGTTIRALIEEALKQLVVEDRAERTGVKLAPLIDEVIQERHKRLESGLRTMIARVAFESIRSHYVLLNFLSEAGIPAEKVHDWHDKGWHYAIKEFRRHLDQVEETP